MAPDASNPFLVPPPPPGTRTPQQAKKDSATPAEDPISVPADFISPPSVITASQTHRVVPPTAPVPAQVEDSPAEIAQKITFFPSTPGVPAGVTAAWHLRLADGRIIPVDRATFIGRNPSRTADRPGAQELPIDDPARSLSKTHALLELDAGSLWVHDLDSTNGVIVAAPGTTATVAEPGERVAVVDGAELRLGSYVIRVAHVT